MSFSQVLAAPLIDVVTVEDFLALKRRAEMSDEVTSGQRLSRIWIYGSGKLGRDIQAVAKFQGIDVIGFIDRNPELWNTYVNGLPVVQLNSDIQEPIVVALYNVGEALRKIKAVTDSSSLSFAEFLLTVGNNALPYWCLQSPLSKITNRELEKILEVESRLDTRSRAEFARQLASRYMIGIEDDYPPTSSPVDEYFAGPHGVIRDKEVLIDIGAYDGDTAVRFLDRVGDRKAEVLAIEPDPQSYGRLLSRLGADPRVRKLNVVVGSEVGSRRIQSSGTVHSRVMSDDGVVVRQTTLDEIIRLEGHATRVKIDVEGSEQDVLAGAKRAIADCAMTWAISTYHRPGDLWEIPEFFEARDYLIDVQSHAQRPWDTVLHFIPRISD